MGLKYFLTILKKEKCFAVLGLSQIKATVESTRESLIEMTTDQFLCLSTYNVDPLSSHIG